MFGKLKEKLGNWAKKFSEKAEPEEAVEKKEAEKEKPKKEKVAEKKEKPAKEKKKTEKKEESKEKYIEVPKKFNAAIEGFEPDLEKIKKIEKELEKEDAAPEKEGFFKKIVSKVQKVTISEEDFESYAEELELMLIENNVALEVVDKIIKKLKEKLVGKELLKKEIESEIKDCLKEIIEEVLIEPFDLIERIKEKKAPYVILFCGINGTGKTTTIAKIADLIKRNNLSCVLAAGDTFRAASIEQIKKHGDKLGIKVISNEYGSDPASVGFDAISYAKKHKINAVLIDTAGRMHTDKNLLKEIEKISKVCKPDTKIFVGESITGNDAVEQVKSFDWAIGIDGIILSKADIDEKGGTALSLGYVTKRPVLYLGTGQEYKDLEKFDKEKFLEKLGL